MWRRHNSARNRGKYPFLCTLAAPLLPLRPSVLMEKSFPEMNHREPRTSGDTALTAWRLPSSPCRVLTDSSDGHNHKEWPGTKTRTEATHKLPKNFFFSNTKGCRWEGQTVYWWLENLSLSGRVFIPQPEKESKWGKSRLYSRVNWGTLSGLWSCNYLDTLGNKVSHTARWSLADAILKAMGIIRPFKTSALLLEFL